MGENLAQTGLWTTSAAPSAWEREFNTAPSLSCFYPLAGIGVPAMPPPPPPRVFTCIASSPPSRRFLYGCRVGGSLWHMIKGVKNSPTGSRLLGGVQVLMPLSL